MKSLELRRNALGLVATGTVVVVATVLMRPQTTAPDGLNLVGKPPPAVRPVELVITSGQLSSGPSQIEVIQHDLIDIKATSDMATTLEVTGHDRRVALRPNRPARLRFTADRPGQFIYRLTNPPLELGVLWVDPAE